jgi:hypothetical protein
MDGPVGAITGCKRRAVHGFCLNRSVVQVYAEKNGDFSTYGMPVMLSIRNPRGEKSPSPRPLPRLSLPPTS